MAQPRPSQNLGQSQGSGVGVVLTSPPPPSLQEATRNSTSAWQEHLESLFQNAKDRFPDVVWELIGDEDGEEGTMALAGISNNSHGQGQFEEVWGHKAIVYARAPPSFQNRYFAVRPAEGMIPYTPSADSALSLGMDNVNMLTTRSPSPSPSTTIAPSTYAPTSLTASGPGPGQGALLRLTTGINPALFSNELEYLYTGKNFGEAFEFLFDTSETRDAGPLLLSATTSTSSITGLGDDPESLRVDKLRKDLVFMWRSRLYSDVRVSVTGDFGGSHESTTAIFSSHRFILVSRSSYFHTALVSWPKNSSNSNEPPTLTLPSPPFTPASLHFTLGFIYAGTLIFSNRMYDLSTAFAILRASLYLSLPTLHDEIQARIAQEMMHGLFHAFIPFSEYENLTGGRWGTGGCRCRQCARRAPRVLEFAMANDVKNSLLERGARRALVGMFGESWCNPDFASLAPKLRESLLKGVGKRTTPLNAFALLFAAEHALTKLSSVVEPWGEVVKDMILQARKGIDEVLVGGTGEGCEQCFGGEVNEWSAIIESEGAQFEDTERVEWAMKSVMRGVKESSVGIVYQTLVATTLLRAHVATDAESPAQPLLPPTSHVRIQVEQTRMDLLKWIGKRWLNVRQENGFDALEGWCIKEISDHIEVPIDDLIPRPTSPSRKNASPRSSQPSPNHNSASIANPTTPSNTYTPSYANNTFSSSANANYKNAANRRNPNPLLRPISNHPHTSRIDAESENSSMRVSVLTRSLAPSVSSVSVNGTRQKAPLSSSLRVTEKEKERNRDSGIGGDTGSVRSLAKSTSSISTVSTVDSTGSGTTISAGPQHKTAVNNAEEDTRNQVQDEDMSPAKRLAQEVRARDRDRDKRPDSKLTPSIVELQEQAYDEDFEGNEKGKSEGSENGDEDSGGSEDGSIVLDSLSESGDKDSTISGTTTSTQNVSKTSRTPVRKIPNDQSKSTNTPSRTQTPPIRPQMKKTLITRASLASVRSAASSATSSPAGRPKSIAPSIRSQASSVSPSNKAFSTQATPTLAQKRKPTVSMSSTTSSLSPSMRRPLPSSSPSRPSSRGSTQTTRSRLTVATTNTGSSRPATASSRPASRVSTRSTSGGPGTPSTRPTSSISTVSTRSTMTTSTVSTVSAADSAGSFRTARSGVGSNTLSSNTGGINSGRPRNVSGASATSSKTTGAGRSSAASSPVQERLRKLSGASATSVVSTTSVKSPTNRTRKTSATTSNTQAHTKKVNVPPVPIVPDGAKLGGAVSSPRPQAIQLSASVELGSSGGLSPSPPLKLVLKKSAESVKLLFKNEASKENENSGEDFKKERKVPVPSELLHEGDLLSLPSPASVLTIRPKAPPLSFSGGNGSGNGSSGSEYGGGEHKKTGSSASTASTSSVVTLKKRGSGDTIRTVLSSSNIASPAEGAGSMLGQQILPEEETPPTPPPKPFNPNNSNNILSPVFSNQFVSTPQQSSPPQYPITTLPLAPSIAALVGSELPGATLEIGIPCIISSKRKRFKAFARYIGEVVGERGPWVGVEVPVPVGESSASWSGGWGASGSWSAERDDRDKEKEKEKDDRQWNDGSWGGIRYFEINGGGGAASEFEFEEREQRAARRRRLDASAGPSSSFWMSGSFAEKGVAPGSNNNTLKREGDQLSISSERMMKRMRSVSPAASDSGTGTETRGLFVRPQQVLYVVDAVGADL